jgi:hypothetical protein
MSAVCNNISSICPIPTRAVLGTSTPTTTNSTFPSPTNYNTQMLTDSIIRIPMAIHVAQAPVDEMLLRATGDEHAGGGAPNGSGTNPLHRFNTSLPQYLRVVEGIERVILRNLIQLIMATGRIQVI